MDNAWKLGVLAEILQRARAAEVPVIVLKGAAMLHRLYQPHERSMLDIDLLIRPGDCHRLFRALGQTVPRLPVDTRSVRPSAPDHEVGCVYAGVAVDIHLRLHPWYIQHLMVIDEFGLWSRSRSFLVNGQPALRLSTEDELLHLTSHTIKHDIACPPEAVEDVRRLLAHETIDWPQLCRLARRQRLRTYTWLLLSRRELRQHVPAWVLAELQPAAARRALLPLVMRLRREGAQVAAPLLLTDRVTDPIRMLGLILVPSKASLHERYPRLRLPVTQLVWHWLRVARLLPCLVARAARFVGSAGR